MTKTTQFYVEIDGKRFLVVRSSDVIEADSKTGVKSWQGHIVQDEADSYYVTSSWCNSNKKTGNVSKTQWATPFYAQPKNVGKANETTNESQAHAEFDSMVRKEQDRRLADRPLPMLAHTYEDKLNPKKGRKHKVHFPCMVQPKFDGMRMLFNGEAGWSRGNKEIIPEVVEHLHFNSQGNIIDGELILPNNPKVNITRSATAKFHPGISDQLVYRVYDIVDETKSYEWRQQVLEGIVAIANNPNVILAETHVVHTHEDILKWHADFTSRGYEGTIIRDMDAQYSPGKRVDGLLKFKDFIDQEYKIIDIIPSGGGSASEVGKCVCVDDKGDTFESTFTGSEDERREYLSNKNKYIGKYAKVKYRELSGAKQVPFHSNVLEIRDTKKEGH